MCRMKRRPDPLTLLRAFERSGDGVYAVDYDQNIVYWNRAAERLLGHKAADVLGRRCFDLIAGGDHLGHPFCGSDCDVIKSARKGRAPANYDVCTRSAEGERRWINVSIVVLAGSKRHDLLTVHLFRDVTEARRRQPPVTPQLSEGPPETADATRVGARLTRRETEVLQYLSTGMSVPRIAETLAVSPTTVRNHIEHMLAKLGVHSQLEAVVLAARHRII